MTRLHKSQFDGSESTKLKIVGLASWNLLRRGWHGQLRFAETVCAGTEARAKL